jgi:hypothetical protein
MIIIDVRSYQQGIEGRGWSEQSGESYPLPRSRNYSTTNTNNTLTRGPTAQNWRPRPRWFTSIIKDHKQYEIVKRLESELWGGRPERLRGRMNRTQQYTYEGITHLSGAPTRRRRMVLIDIDPSQPEIKEGLVEAFGRELFAAPFKKL